MSLAYPFDVYLPRPDLAAQVVAPPYDSLGIDEARRLVADNPLSFLNLVRSEVDHPELGDEERRAMLGETAARLRTLIADGVYRHVPGPAYLVCRLAQHGHTQTGVIADLPLSGYDEGRVRVHESTRKGQEDRLVEYMQAVRANFLPLFMIFRPAAAVGAAVAEATALPPLIDLDAGDDLQITLWVVDEPGQVAALAEALALIDTLYVADGHHRAAAASRFAAAQRAAYPGAGSHEPWQRVLAVLFPSDQLRIHAYHRCIADLGGGSPADLLAALTARFPVEEVTAAEALPRAPGEVSVHIGGRWHRVELPGADRSVGAAGLDAALLQDHILGPLLGVADPRIDPRLEFVPGTQGLAELDRMCEQGYAAAFALHPTAVDELLVVADRGEVMPPKSTWFAPKLRSGLVVRLL